MSDRTGAGEIAAVREFIKGARSSYQTNKVLHGYPSQFLWRERDVSVPEVVSADAGSQEKIDKQLNLYVATPYCLPTDPARCGFCVFPSVVYENRRQLEVYFEDLRHEAGLYRGLLTDRTVGGLYFGGGTSNLYKPEQYAELMDIADSLAGRVPRDVEITLEGVPQLFTREKLEAIRAVGINRISIGVQQLEAEMIRFSGRQQTAEQTFQTIEWCRELGFSCSVDLIYGWPTQRVENMVSDLEAITATGVPHITHYELNLGGRTDFALKQRDLLPTPRQNLEMFREAKKLLEAKGYKQVSTYDWKLYDPGDWNGDYRFGERWMNPLSVNGDSVNGVDMIGLGFAGVSFFVGTPGRPGWAWINHTNIGKWQDSVRRGEFPVERGYRYSEEDLRLNVLVRQLLSGRVDRQGIRRTFGIDPVREHPAVWKALSELGWVEISDETIQLVGDGVYHTPLVQTAVGKFAHLDQNKSVGAGR